MLGKVVKVIVDRPLGTYHQKQKDLFYPVNYGYTGKVIAVIHRFDDVEEKLVVVPTDASLTKEEIKRQVDFQEQFFKTEIKM